MGSDPSNERSEIVFFDLETTVPNRSSQGCAILEFGAIIFSSKLVELRSYSTLVRPANPSLIYSLSERCNGITRDAVVSAPSFSDIADTVYEFLNGRIWAGHNIERFDCALIREAFAEIGRPPPEPKGIIDSLALLTQKFGKRAGDMKMDSLATYFGLGKQKHRSLDDVRMNLEVLKCCAAVLLLESSLPDAFPGKSWVSPNAQFLKPDEVSIPSIRVSFVPFFHGSPRMVLLHEDVNLQLCCPHLRVRFGLSTKYSDQAGRPRLSFEVDPSSSLCGVLDACDDIAQKSSGESGSSSNWRHVVNRRPGFANNPTVRMHIPYAVNGDLAQYETEMYQKDPSGTTQKLVFSNFDAAELDTWFSPGTLVDAYFSLDPYDYQQSAGIRLVAKKLVICQD